MPENATQKSVFSAHSERILGAVLCLTTLAVYGQVRTYEFINFDDGAYVAYNQQVQSGLTRQSIVWAFTNTMTGNWHPLTWLSHMADVHFFGMDAGTHHLINVMFHIANTLLLFGVFNRMTGRLWQSAFMAAMFALHPLHVESVAWVSERKDVLCAFFWFLTTAAYLKYVRTLSLRYYLMSLNFFVMGLLSKSMIVTLPFVLLLLDYWPLKRFEHLRAVESRIVLEKIPFFLGTAAGCLTAVVSQVQGHAVGSLKTFPLYLRMGNALYAYVEYLKKCVFPVHLTYFYPYPEMFRVETLLTAGLLLAGISFLAVKTADRYPYFFVGWFWYIGTLIPVIGLVQIGLQGMADRYTYIPLIGIFIIAGWGVSEFWNRTYQPILIIGTGIVLFPMMTAVTWTQIQYWKNSITLNQRAIAAVPDNYMGYVGLGSALGGSEAIRLYRQAVRIAPDYSRAHCLLGTALMADGNLDEAIHHFRLAIQLEPAIKDAHNNLGVALAMQGRFQEAVPFFQEAVRLNPDDVGAANNLKRATDKLNETVQ